MKIFERRGFVLEVREHEIYQYLQKNEGKTTMKAICDALVEGKDQKQTIKDKLLMMARFKIITINGENVTLKQHKST
jgi:hypothetical protein